jgi:hypothetical protein
MKLEMMRFKGEPVGIQLTAESEEDRTLFWALRGLTVRVSETLGMENPNSLFVCPRLPWRNLEDRDMPPGADV